MSHRCPGAGWGESPKPPLGNQLSSFILRGCHRGKLRITSRCLHGSVLYHAQSFNLCRDPARTASVSPQGDQCQQRGRRLLRAPTSSPVNRANDSFWAGWGTDRVPASEGEALAPCSIPDKMLHGEVHLSSTDFSNRGERAILPKPMHRHKLTRVHQGLNPTTLDIHSPLSQRGHHFNDPPNLTV